MGRKRSTMLAAVFAAVFVLGSCADRGPSGDVAMGPAPGDAIEIVALDNSFEPDEIQVMSGQEITVQISNEGRQPHDFVIRSLEVNTGILGPGQIAHATFVVPRGGVEFDCTLHARMDGRIEAS